MAQSRPHPTITTFRSPGRSVCHNFCPAASGTTPSTSMATVASTSRTASQMPSARSPTISMYRWRPGEPVAVPAVVLDDARSTNSSRRVSSPACRVNNSSRPGVIPRVDDQTDQPATLVDLVSPGSATEYWLGYGISTSSPYNRSSFTRCRCSSLPKRSIDEWTPRSRAEKLGRALIGLRSPPMAASRDACRAASDAAQLPKRFKLDSANPLARKGRAVQPVLPESGFQRHRTHSDGESRSAACRTASRIHSRSGSRPRCNAPVVKRLEPVVGKRLANRQ